MAQNLSEEATYEVALAARIRAATFDGIDFSKFTKADVADLNLCDAICDIVEKALEASTNSNTVLPIIVHFDEYGKYNESMQKHVGDGTTYFQNLVLSIRKAVNMQRVTGRLTRFAGRYFIVPVATGTSFRDVSFGTSISKNEKIMLRLLQETDRISLATALLDSMASNRDYEIDAVDVKTVLEDNLFHVALGDTGGLPGFVFFLCTSITKKMIRDGTYIASLNSNVKNYVGTLEDSETYYAEIEHLMNSRVILYPGDKFKDKKATILSLSDRGCIHAEATGSEGGFRVLVAPVMTTMFQGFSDYSSIVPLLGKSKGWTWEQFEKAHAHFISKTLSGLFECKGRFDCLCLNNIFRGSKYSYCLADKMAADVHVQRMDCKVDRKQCFKKATRNHSNREAKSNPVEVEDMNHVHIAAPDTPFIDAYFNLAPVDTNSKPITVFLQYKYSSESQNLNVKDILTSYDGLILALQATRIDIWNRRDILYVIVTNRTTSINPAKPEDRRIVWIDRSSLEEHMHVFGGRGLYASHSDICTAYECKEVKHSEGYCVEHYKEKCKPTDRCPYFDQKKNLYPCLNQAETGFFQRGEYAGRPRVYCTKHKRYKPI